MIPITKPTIGDAEAQAAAEVIRSGWLAQGPRVMDFERTVADYVGSRHAVATSSGTGALHLALVALDLGPGDEVILPSLSYIATANVVRYVGATPVFVDVDPRTFNLEVSRLEEVVTSRTRVILPVHQLGLPAELDPLLALARRRGLAVVEDGACALGASYRGRRIGAAGSTICCFSFHPRKVITTGEGGMLTTDDEALARRLTALRAHGAVVPAHQRHQSRRVPDEEHGELGYNYRLTDVQAAVGVEQMRRLDGLLARRRELAARYGELLAAHEAITPPAVPQGLEHTFQSYMVLLDEALLARVPRHRIMQQLLDQQIATRRAVMAIHLQPLYGDVEAPPLPVTERVARCGLILPLYPQMSAEDQVRVVAALAEACRP